MAEMTIIGQRVERPEGLAKATGQMAYVADVSLPGMLHAKLLRSPHAHARIRSIDTSRAKALPGVRAVLTGRDVDILDHEPTARAHAYLAYNRVVFAGQPVAAVAADDVHTAEEAIDLISVDYEVLPASIDTLEALKDGAPLVREHAGDVDLSEAQAHSTVSAGSVEDKSGRPSNVASRMHLAKGDVEKGFAESDIIIEKTYYISRVHQGYMEPRATIASWDVNGNLTVYVSVQGQFHVRSELANILRLNETQITVIPMEIGGGFGAKIQPIVEPITALLAKRVKRPVKLVLTRAEELIAATPAPETIIELKTGVKKDGTLVALKSTVIMDTGCFQGAPVNNGCLMVAGFYRFPVFDVDGIEVLTHKPSQAAYRAPGAPHATFAIDSQMEAIALALGVDPVQFRIRHCIVEGDPMPHGQPWPNNGMKQVIEAVAQHPIWKEHKKAPNRGIAMGVGGWLGGIQPASATVRLNPDGTVSVITGAIDLTGTNTAFLQIAAEELGVPLAICNVRTANTDSAPYAGMSAGSKVVYTVGNAVLAAAADARRQILEIAAQELEAAPADLELVGTDVRVKGTPERSVTLARVARVSTMFGGRYEPVFGRGSITVTKQSPGFCAHIAEVEVDPDTGKVTVLRYVAIQDVGKTINPTLCEGQIQGGTAQSIGLALSEEQIYSSEGRLLNPTLLDYRTPTAIDLPAIEVQLLEIPSPFGPFGAKGVGEPPIIPAGAAVANALRNAVGRDFTHLPVTPERIVQALSSSNGHAANGRV